MWKSIILDVECIVCNKSLQKINHDPREVSRKMGKIVNRRSRTPNWSLEEKQYLLELINERRAVITKTTNGPNHYEEKDVAWNEILRQLTLRFGNKFHGSSIKKVKTQWQNMKRIAREEITLNGPQTNRYTRQSIQVCNILDLVQDGVLVNRETDTSALNDVVPSTSGLNSVLNETVTSIITMNETITSSKVPSVEIKTERIDDEQEEEVNQVRLRSTENLMDTDATVAQEEPVQIQNNKPDESHKSVEQPLDQSETSSSCVECPSDSQDEPTETVNKKNTATENNKATNNATNDSNDNQPTNPYNRVFREFLKFTAVEKHLKLETLKEERQVVRAMRETAELNKIIAEQRLKHVLWRKRQDMA